MTFWGSITVCGPGQRVALAILAVSLSACGAIRPQTDSPRTVLRVGTSGDYAPFSIAGAGVWTGSDRQPATPPNPQRNPQESPSRTNLPSSPTGFDPAVASAYAADRGLAIEWVRFRWPELLTDLAADRFDVAMSGVTVRPERSLAGRFSVPVCQTGALLLIDAEATVFRSRDATSRTSKPGSSRSGNAPGGFARAEIDRPAVRIAVNAGGHLERVTRRHFPNARVIAVPDNAAVLEKVLSGQADAAATDSQEVSSWAARAPALEIWGPFTRDYKAYLLRPDREELAVDLDDWLQANEANGRLASLRSAHLSGEQPALATGLPALVSGIAERLALMPMVAEAKRRSGDPIEVPEREERVIQAGSLRTQQVAAELGIAAPDAAAVRALFRAQIEAAKAIQRAVLAGPPIVEDPPDLGGELRPALIRIGDRLAGLIVGLPTQPRAEPHNESAHRDAVRTLTRNALAPHGLDEVRIDAIADAVARLSSTRNARDGAGGP